MGPRRGPSPPPHRTRADALWDEEGAHRGARNVSFPQVPPRIIPSTAASRAVSSAPDPSKDKKTELPSRYRGKQEVEGSSATSGFWEDFECLFGACRFFGGSSVSAKQEHEDFELADSSEAVTSKDGKGQVDLDHIDIASKSSIGTEVSESRPRFEDALNFCGIALGAYIGTLVRAGISYYRIWPIESNFTVMYAIIIGCVTFGFVTEHKFYFTTGGSRIWRVIFVTLTAGFCDSMTPFATWCYECNKIFLLQWDMTYGNIMGSYNGGRFFEFLICLWTGVAIPLAALRLGQHLALLSSRSDENLGGPLHHPSGKEAEEAELLETRLEMTLLFTFVFATIVVVVVPVSYQWEHFAWLVFFGVIGAYSRFQLCTYLNRYVQAFPLGTFIANVLGTWAIAVFTILAKLVVEYTDHPNMTVMYGVIFGFCGCYTTISSFVYELDRMSIRGAYLYGFWTIFLAQLGLIFFFDIPIFTAVPAESVMPPAINFCNSYEYLCDQALQHVNCPGTYRIVKGCRQNSMNNWAPICSCGKFNVTDQVATLLIDAQTRSNVSKSMVAVWPTRGGSDPASTIDFCLSYENTCQHMLSRIGCPSGMWQLNGCNHMSIMQYTGKCSCGGMQHGDMQIANLVSEVALFRGYDMLSYGGFPTLGQINFCSAYEDVCNKLLNHVQCPSSQRQVASCSQPGNYSSFQGLCSCGGQFTFSSARVTDALVTSILKPNSFQLMSYPTTKWNQGFVLLDACKSADNMCSFFLSSIGCPPTLQLNISTCNVTDPTMSPEQVAALYNVNITSFRVQCECAAIKVSKTISNLVTEATLAMDLVPYTYIPNPVAPYTLAAASDPFRPLMAGQTPYPSY
jgi:fluoride ion exporter CrcB/FEX